ncbi:MAG: hypothetical protein KC425_01580 [Anaerolineales bacterium]|nr:hypothetical protein [Anaerolineales bacterium]
MSQIKVDVNGEVVDLAVSRQGDEIRVVRDGETAVLHLVAGDSGELLLEQRHADGTRERIRVVGHLAGDKRQVWVNGRLFTYERVRERGGAAAGGDASLAAAIPAVVSQVLVDVGDAVAEGDKLLLLESMKMVIPIQAPYDGVVTAVRCTAGESVQAGVQLIELEQTEG